jgi:hypothetical protein
VDPGPARRARLSASSRLLVTRVDMSPAWRAAVGPPSGRGCIRRGPAPGADGGETPESMGSRYRGMGGEPDTFSGGRCDAETQP